MYFMYVFMYVFMYEARVYEARCMKLAVWSSLYEARVYEARLCLCSLIRFLVLAASSSYLLM
jgi:hypothetical protein